MKYLRIFESLHHIPNIDKISDEIEDLMVNVCDEKDLKILSITQAWTNDPSNTVWFCKKGEDPLTFEPKIGNERDLYRCIYIIIRDFDMKGESVFHSESMVGEILKYSDEIVNRLSKTNKDVLIKSKCNGLVMDSVNVYSLKIIIIPKSKG